MKLAVFGDVHGKLDALYTLCEKWQQAQGHRIALVLQAGDFGLWPTAESMDAKNRRRYAADTDFGLIGNLLSGRRTAPFETWFVHGNNEPFDLLRRHENAALDAAGRLVYLGPGSVRTFEKYGQRVRIAGLGGMEYRFGKHAAPSAERVQKYLYGPALDALRGQSADILLLHDAPLNMGLRRHFPTGSRRITELVAALQPRLLFYGHYDDPPEPFMLGSTVCVGMNQHHACHLPGCEGAFGIVETRDWTFSFAAG